MSLTSHVNSYHFLMHSDVHTLVCLNYHEQNENENKVKVDVIHSQLVFIHSEFVCRIFKVS